MSEQPKPQRPLVFSDATRRREVFHSSTRGRCPQCLRAVDAVRLIREGKIWLRKQCPEHGPSEALISADADWFLGSLGYVKPGSIPLEHSTEVDSGCPDDCGLCPDHEQHTCMPIIEITDHCNLTCPICLVDNRNSYHMSKEELAGILEGLVRKEGSLETINFSGGEPTLHPELLDLLDMATAVPQIARVSISTNGVRLAAEPQLCEQLAKRGVYVSLQLDGLEGCGLETLRGSGDHATSKRKALDNLERAGVLTTIVATIAKNISDQNIDDQVRLLYERDFILSLMFQPAAYTQNGTRFEPHDPLDVVTIPDVIHAAEEQTDGLLRRSDFLPLPCSHPSCFALTYLLQVDDGFVPFARFLDLDQHLDIIANRGTIRPDEHFETAIRDTIDALWTGAAQVPDCDKILKSLRRAIFLMYPEDRAVELEERLKVGEGMVKTIFIHAFMGPHSFDVERIKKCCTHYALPDGRLMPGCAYNVLHRRNDTRFGQAGESS